MPEWAVNVIIKRLTGREAFRKVSVFCLTAQEALGVARRVVETPGLLVSMGHKAIGPLVWHDESVVVMHDNVVTVRATEQ